MSSRYHIEATIRQRKHRIAETAWVIKHEMDLIIQKLAANEAPSTPNVHFALSLAQEMAALRAEERILDKMDGEW